MPIALIIGAGSNVGQATADTFANAGYEVVVASRSAKLASKFKHFTVDVSKPEAVTVLFNEVRESVGQPSVVIYNAYSSHIAKSETPFEIPFDVVQNDMNVNTISAYVAAGEAVKSFEALGEDGLGVQGGTFIFTGNILNEVVIAGFLTFGMEKSAAAHMIQNLALVAYPEKPYKFYYGDERHADASPVPKGLSGPGHAELYLDLAKDPKQRKWQQTFVTGKGYVEFPRQEAWSFSK